MLNVVRSALKEFDSKPFIHILDNGGPILLDVGPVSLDPFQRSISNRPLSRGGHFVSRHLKSFVYARLAS